MGGWMDGWMDGWVGGWMVGDRNDSLADLWETSSELLSFLDK